MAVIINPSAGIVDQNKTTNGTKNHQRNFFIIIFDSLIEAAENKHTLVLEYISEYLTLEYMDKKAEYQLPGDGFDKSYVKLVIPKGMPQQKNFVDCGLFLLQFAEIFMTNPPKVS